MDRRFVVCVITLGICVVSSDCTYAADKTPIKAEIAKLVEQLGSDAYVEREEASKKLDEIGPPALEELRKAVASADAEVQRRARDLVGKIDRRAQADKVLSASKIRLNFKDTLLADALKETAGKCGIPLMYEGDQANLAKRRITLDTGEVPFWQAFDQFCAQAKVADKKQLTSVEADRKQMVVEMRANRMPARAKQKQKEEEPVAKPKEAGPDIFKAANSNGADLAPLVLVDLKGASPAQCYAGAVRISHRPEKQAGPSDELEIALLLSAEPRLHKMTVIGLQIDKAIDDHGQNLAMIASDGVVGQVPMNAAVAFVAAPPAVAAAGPFALVQEPVSVRLKKGEKPARKLEELKGVLSLQVETAPQEIVAVEKILDAAGKTVKGARGGSITVHEATKLASGVVRLRVEIEAPADMLDAADLPVGAAPAIANIQMRAQAQAQQAQVRRLILNQAVIGGVRGGQNELSGLSLLDAKGERFQLRSSSARMVVNNNQMSRQYTLTYQGKADQGGPVKLVFAGAKSTAVDVPFSLKNVTLP